MDAPLQKKQMKEARRLWQHSKTPEEIRTALGLNRREITELMDFLVVERHQLDEKSHGH